MYLHQHTQPDEVNAVSASVRKTPSMFSSVSHTRGRELLERLANTTLNLTRTMAKVNTTDSYTNNMSSIKVNLDSQLTAVEGKEHDLKSCDSCHSHRPLSAQSDLVSVLYTSWPLHSSEFATSATL